ncbi:LAFA_0G13344g1_1 [Lachancea sp. 'fantastica']|nr:LAFA_0G13344g1_1 [Lachancea sp. 'fantastica']
MAHNESRKRTRPCVLCKRNKVKCHYVTSLPCERCAKYGLRCQFEQQSVAASLAELAALPSLTQSHPLESEESQALEPACSAAPNDPKAVNARLNTLESALESVLSILQTNQSQQQQQMDLIQQQIIAQPPGDKWRSLDLHPSLAAVTSQDAAAFHEGAPNFRLSNILSEAEVKELGKLFDDRFAPQLFGYEIGTLDVHSLWKTSPFLLLSICTVTCLHHPSVAPKFSMLKRSFEVGASQCLMQAVPATQVEHTILALVVGALWLESAQMLVSVAIQLARIHRLDQPNTFPSSLGPSPLHRLWYLLYIVDGNQNLILHKSPSINQASEPLIRNSRRDVIASLASPQVREVLSANYHAQGKVVNNRQLELLNEVECRKISISGTSLRELRLLGQLEYHMAMESVFSSNSSYMPDFKRSMQATASLLDPTNFGIPWASNLELDKWMISWTITLQNIDFQSDPWCLKSTLLYYNFARMHINMKPSLTGGRSSVFDNGTSDLSKLWQTSDPMYFPDSTKAKDASHDISFSAAQSLIKLATDDSDITSIFQFLPMHVQAMLYYASLVLLDPTDIEFCDTRPRPSRKVLVARYKTVNKLRNLVEKTPSSDPTFRSKTLESLNQLLDRFAAKCFAAKTASAQDHQRVRCQEIIEEDNIVQDDKGPRTIIAWPGTNPGHP